MKTILSLLTGKDTSLGNTMLAAFDRWFASTAGVYQTLLLVLAAVIAEQIWPQLDPSSILLLYWLTVYSAVTQPALAHTGKASADRLQALEQDIDTVLHHVETLLQEGAPCPRCSSSPSSSSPS